MKKQKLIKVAVLYRVIQHWRLPMFERLANSNGIDLTLYYGADFPGTKVVSAGKIDHVKSKKLSTIKISRKISTKAGRQMPFCPTLFWRLIIDRPDVILTEGSSNFANAFQGFLYAKLFGRKIIWWGLGKLQNETKNSRKDDFIRFFEKRCDAQLVYSSVGKEYYESMGYPSKQIFTAVNVVDTDKIAAIRSTAEYQNSLNQKRGFNILYVGAIFPRKRVDMLVKAYANFSKDKEDVTLTIVGDGSSLKEIRSLAKSLDIKSITFTGQIIEGSYKYFAIADVFVLPGMGGLAISEAMAHELPVIVSVGDGCEVDLVDSTNGFRDVNLNENSLAEYLQILYEDREKLVRLKTASLDKIANCYNVHTYINAIVNCIKSV